MINYKYDIRLFIGKKVEIVNEKEIGVVTRIDIENHIIYVLFKRMIEKSYLFPDILEKNMLKLI